MISQASTRDHGCFSGLNSERTEEYALAWPAMLRARVVCGAHSAALWQSLTQFSTQAVLMDRITAAAPQHEYGRRLAAGSTPYSIALSLSLSVSRPPPLLLAFQSSKTDEGGKSRASSSSSPSFHPSFSSIHSGSSASLVVPSGRRRRRRRRRAT